MMARFERGEVLLTARMVEILRQLALRVVPRDVAPGSEIGKGETGKFTQFAGLAKRENPLSIEGHRKLGAQPWLDFWRRKPETSGNRVGDLELKHHELFSVVGTTVTQCHYTPEEALCHARKSR